MYTTILFKNTKDFQFRALDFDLDHKNEVNRVGCTTRNRLDFDLANKNEVNRVGCTTRNRLDSFTLFL